ncbi:MAG: ZIP family metal transporter, partial [Thiohalomonadales bacterium]
MPTFAWILIFSLLTGVLSVLAAATFLLLPERYRRRLIPHLVSFAIGSLLGAAFLGLLPHALASQSTAEIHNIFLAVLVGLLGFFLLEKFVLWRHCHSDHCEAHAPESQEQQKQPRERAAGTLVLVGDAMHNFVDGILLSAAFLTDIHLGVVTAIAIAAHEIPQEVGDFVVLLHSGFSRRRALIFNVISSLATLIGATLAYLWLTEMASILPYVLAVAASSF